MAQPARKNRVAAIPPATSSASTRIEFKLEIISMLEERVKQLVSEKAMATGSKLAEIESGIVELNAFKRDVQAVEFKIDTTKKAT